MVQWKERGQTT